MTVSQAARVESSRLTLLLSEILCILLADLLVLYLLPDLTEPNAGNHERFEGPPPLQPASLRQGKALSPQLRSRWTRCTRKAPEAGRAAEGAQLVVCVARMHRCVSGPLRAYLYSIYMTRLQLIQKLLAKDACLSAVVTPDRGVGETAIHEFSVRRRTSSTL